MLHSLLGRMRVQVVIAQQAGCARRRIHRNQTEGLLDPRSKQRRQPSMCRRLLQGLEFRALVRPRVSVATLCLRWQQRPLMRPKLI